MDDLMEQIKQDVAGLIAQYPAQVMRDMVMGNLLKAPHSDKLEYWEDVKNSMLNPKPQEG